MGDVSVCMICQVRSGLVLLARFRAFQLASHPMIDLRFTLFTSPPRMLIIHDGFINWLHESRADVCIEMNSWKWLRCVKRPHFCALETPAG